MPPSPPAWLHSLLTGLLAWTLLPALSHGQTEIDERIDARPDGTVEITNIAGSVIVTGWERSEVEITGVLGRGLEDIEIESYGNRIAIEVSYRTARHGGSADLEIRAPVESRIVVETVSAEIRLAGFAGEVELESVSGTVTVEDEPESVDVETVSGNIEIEGCRGRITAESVNGNVLVAGGRDVEAGSVSGILRIRGRKDLRRADLETVSGKIEFEGELGPQADLIASSHNGSIDLTLAGESSASFEVSSFSGRIRNELGPEARRDRFSPGRELRFKTGRGEARVRIESFSGSVTLKPLSS